MGLGYRRDLFPNVLMGSQYQLSPEQIHDEYEASSADDKALIENSHCEVFLMWFVGGGEEEPYAVLFLTGGEYILSALPHGSH